jgi:hypothetical protein
MSKLVFQNRIFVKLYYVAESTDIIELSNQAKSGVILGLV